MVPHLPSLNIRVLYDSFDAPVVESLDCGQMCAPHNPSGKPFCCDICHAVPVAYRQEWDYLQPATDLWHIWRGDECTAEPVDRDILQADTPDYMRLLACLGPALCQRPFRAVSCRQFPFFPYISSDDRFLGLAYEWDFEPTCWVISNLGRVSLIYRAEFVRFYDHLLALWPEDFESYAGLSEDMRLHFAAKKRRFPLLHRNGGAYLVSPVSERLRRVDLDGLPRFGPYK